MLYLAIRGHFILWSEWLTQSLWAALSSLILDSKTREFLVNFHDCHSSALQYAIRSAVFSTISKGMRKWHHKRTLVKYLTQHAVSIQSFSSNLPMKQKALLISTAADYIFLIFQKWLTVENCKQCHGTIICFLSWRLQLLSLFRWRTKGSWTFELSKR